MPVRRTTSERILSIELEPKRVPNLVDLVLFYVRFRSELLPSAGSADDLVEDRFRPPARYSCATFAQVLVFEPVALPVDGFRIDSDRCGACGRCVAACAYDALRLIGEVYSPEQLMKKLLVDRPYYERSGGRGTFIGGEPTLHLDFLDCVLDLCGRESIYTNLKTSGTFSFERWKLGLRKFDLIYFALKILDRELHRRHLSEGYETIAGNANILVEGGFAIEFRLPRVPGYTDTKTNVERVIRRLGRLGKRTVHLLSYHNMGETKIDIIAGKQPKLGLERCSDVVFDSVVERFERRGIEVLNRH